MGAVCSWFMFPAPRPTYTRESLPLLWVPRETSPIPCLFVRAEQAKHVVLYFHGNACDLGGIRASVEHYSRELQAHVVAMEYPGYGVRGGTASEGAINEDALCVLQFLLDRGVCASQILVFGHSIGSGPAVELAQRMSTPAAGLVLQSPYTSIRGVARAHSSLGVLAPAIWDSASNIARARCPVLVVHGTADEIIPHAHGQKLYELAQHPKRLVSLLRNHNTLNARDMVGPIHSFFIAPRVAPQLHLAPEWFVAP